MPRIPYLTRGLLIPTIVAGFLLGCGPTNTPPQPQPKIEYSQKQEAKDTQQLIAQTTKANTERQAKLERLEKAARIYKEFPLIGTEFFNTSLLKSLVSYYPSSIFDLISHIIKKLINSIDTQVHVCFIANPTLSESDFFHYLASIDLVVGSFIGCTVLLGVPLVLLSSMNPL